MGALLLKEATVTVRRAPSARSSTAAGALGAGGGGGVGRAGTHTPSGSSMIHDADLVVVECYLSYIFVEV